jgi:hypothetical protein
MSKDAYWFRHDCNARNDDKMVRLRRLHGIEGVGLYWCVIEALRETKTYKLPLDSADDICYELRCGRNVFDALFACKLLKRNDKVYWSDSLLRRMRQLDGVREKRRESGRLGGQANAKQMLSKKEAKGEAKSSDQSRSDQSRSEEKRIPPKPPEGFTAFWDSYPKKVGKKAALSAWGKAKDKPSTDAIVAAVARQCKSDKWQEEGGKYIPNPSTWLNQGRWDDEVRVGGLPSKRDKRALERRLEALDSAIYNKEEIDMERAAQLIAEAVSDKVPLPNWVTSWMDTGERDGTMEVAGGKIVGWDGV